MVDTQNDTDLQVFTNLTESLDITPRCESKWCAEVLGKDSHAAEWFAVFTCKHDVYWCSDRLAVYQAAHHNGGVRCDNHPQSTVVWLTDMTPVTS